MKMSCSVTRMNNHQTNKKADSDHATSMNYGVASSLSWSKSICNPKTGMVRITRPTKRSPPFKAEHLKQALVDQPACNYNYYAYLQADQIDI